VDETYLARLVEQESRLSTGRVRKIAVLRYAQGARFGVSADTVRGSAALSNPLKRARRKAIKRY
jgi:hypothetical protein